MKRILLVFLFLVFFVPQVSARSSYVLPYPGAMPGNKVYKLNLIKEKLEKYFYFGNFSEFSYNLKYSDKYLVEAKTLFEYKQFLLGESALKKSDNYFKNLQLNLDKAKSERKNISQKKEILKEASLKHIEVLNELKKEVPEKFNWQPEKVSPTFINLWTDIEVSISERIKNE